LILVKLSAANLLASETNVRNSVKKYIRAEVTPTNTASRKWMGYAIETSTEKNLSIPAAARLYAYVASVYADVLEISDSIQASIATAKIINILIPTSKEQTDRFLLFYSPSQNLDSQPQQIFNQYAARIESDGSSLVWDEQIPPGKDKWYIRNNQVDQTARAGAWKPWLLTADDHLDVPPPPKTGSIADMLELEKVKYAVNQRDANDSPNIYFWIGSNGTERSNLNEAITIPSVWENIMYVELTNSYNKGVKDKDYARAQKILAQTIADAAIESWKVKYQFFTQPPSMRIPGLASMLSDPPYPNYVSGQAAISTAAAAVLANLYPEHDSVWSDNARDARNSQILGGINYEADIRTGEYLGSQIAKKIMAKLKLEQKNPAVTSKPGQNLLDIFNLGLFKIQPALAAARTKILKQYKKFVSKPSFANVIDKSGIAKSTSSLGAAWTDYDNDGNLDLLMMGTDQKLFHGNGDGTFTEVPRGSGLDNGERSYSGAFADYDNDGCKDLYISTAGGPDGGRADELFKGNCKGTFTNVTAAARIKDTLRGRGVAWGDYDKDGFLDLYVANHGLEQNETYLYEPNILYHNNKDGTFTNVTDKAGALGGAECPRADQINPRLKRIGGPYKQSFQPIWFDYNNDGWPDLFVTTDSGYSPLYKNNGDGTFTDMTKQAGMCISGTGMGVSAGDYNNDGWLDLYVTNTGLNFFWKNNGDGTFSQISQKNGTADDTALGWGTVFLDYNNDGWLDLYVVNGKVEGGFPGGIGFVRLDKLYRNDGKGQFKEVAEDEGIYGNDAKEAAALADYNQDGFVDLFVVGSYLEDKAEHRLYKNRANKNNWLTIQLIGTKSNRDAIGTRINLTAGNLTQMREVVAGSSYISQESLWPTFGLGVSSSTQKIEIRWPSGIIQTLTDVKVNQKLTVTEPQN
ncbi:MAG TPA: FG-GAP-like repeat-containing protein, partial [Patescibacteria group bacterium]|nr:FG-GAP-like repeat-containing protein [Patescibacteria group bacterium]